MAIRYKGLTEEQRSRVLCAMRPDTIVVGGGGYPAEPSQIQTPPDGDTINWWYDAGHNQSAFSSQSDVISYDGSLGGAYLESVNSEDLRSIGSLGELNFGNLNYWEFFHTKIINDFQEQVLTLALRFKRPANLNDGDVKPIFGTGFGVGNAGFQFSIENNGGNHFVNAGASDQNSNWLWQCTSSNSNQMSSTPSGFDSVTFIFDGSGGVFIFQGSGLIFDSPYTPVAEGVSPAGPVVFGYDDNNSLHSEILLQGMIIDQGPRTHSDGNTYDWIDGNDYTPA